MSDYNQLKVWRRSVDLAIVVYRATANFPKDETFGLRMQMRRAAVSVPCNLAEGAGRSTRKDYRHFAIQARGSVFELQTQIVISGELGFLDRATHTELTARAAEIGKMVNGLIRYLTPNP
jgi:four helix bundle protein